MSEWQLIVAMLLAWGWGRWKEPLIMAVLTANFIATMFLAADPKMVATMDVLALAVLVLIGTRRADLVGGLFAAMIPIYWLTRMAGVQPWVAYAVADLLCYAQIMVAGHGDSGIRNLGSFVRRGAFGAGLSHGPRRNTESGRFGDLDKG